MGDRIASTLMLTTLHCELLGGRRAYAAVDRMRCPENRLAARNGIGGGSLRGEPGGIPIGGGETRHRGLSGLCTSSWCARSLILYLESCD